MRYFDPQIDDTHETAFTERLELAEIRNEPNCSFLMDLYGRKFDFTRRLFVGYSRFDSKLATYYHLNEDGSFVRAEDLSKKEG